MTRDFFVSFQNGVYKQLEPELHTTPRIRSILLEKGPQNLFRTWSNGSLPLQRIRENDIGRSAARRGGEQSRRNVLGGAPPGEGVGGARALAGERAWRHRAGGTGAGGGARSVGSVAPRCTCGVVRRGRLERGRSKERWPPGECN